jgi:hypothetical protein
VEDKHNNDQVDSSGDQQGLAQDKSRRNFLKAAVVASAAVAVAGGAAGVAIATGKTPAPFLSFVGFVASGVCLDLKQAGKFGANNPNNFLQVASSNLDSFGTASATKNGDGNYPLTFTRCGDTHQISFTLTDKSKSQYVIQGTLVETGGYGSHYSYEDGSNSVLYLAMIDVTGAGTDPTASLDHEFPTGSCLTLSCS